MEKDWKVIVSLSGGMDSATALALALRSCPAVECVGFSYESKHNALENEMAARLAAHYRVPFTLIDLGRVMAGFKSDLLLSGGAIPEGHYTDESMKRTVVPGRNTIFLAVLLGLAQSRGAREVWAGIHAGDHAIYADCRPRYARLMQDVYGAASEGTVELVTPFLYLSKGDIAKQGVALGVPYQYTRTCYTTDPVACGRCGSCRERLSAFKEVGVEDPLEYQYRDPDPDRR